MKDLIIQIITAVVQLTIAGGVGFLIRFLNAKAGEVNIKKYSDLVKTAVMAIEQTMSTAVGADKKRAVEEYLSEHLGKKLSPEDKDKLIEAAVFEMNQTINSNLNVLNKPTV